MAKAADDGHHSKSDTVRRRARLEPTRTLSSRRRHTQTHARAALPSRQQLTQEQARPASMQVLRSASASEYEPYRPSPRR